MEQSQKVIEKLNGSDYEGKPLVVELTNRKNKVFIKAKHHENALEELKSNLKDWTFEEIETPEVSADNNHSLVLVKFANEAMAIAFLEDFALNPAKCTLIRSNYHQSS
jgi:predicted nucleotide-binding protein